MQYDPVIGTLKLTKQAAASRQISAAIDALERGAYDVAITLAGAAEGMLPEIASQPLFRMLRDNPNVPPHIERKHWLSAINAERDWLKHPTTVLGDTLEIDLNDACIMVLRALAKLPEWTPRMELFKDWVVANGLQPMPGADPIEP